LTGHGLDSSAVGFQARSYVRTVGPLLLSHEHQSPFNLAQILRNTIGNGAKAVLTRHPTTRSGQAAGLSLISPYPPLQPGPEFGNRKSTTGCRPRPAADRRSVKRSTSWRTAISAICPGPRRCTGTLKRVRQGRLTDEPVRCTGAVMAAPNSIHTRLPEVLPRFSCAQGHAAVRLVAVRCGMDASSRCPCVPRCGNATQTGRVSGTARGPGLLGREVRQRCP
jgi:hypothetical protein